MAEGPQILLYLHARHHSMLLSHKAPHLDPGVNWSFQFRKWFHERDVEPAFH